ncbi:MAG: hypothetical protein ACREPQ_14135 [Rhodanobacter sp.]
MSSLVGLDIGYSQVKVVYGEKLELRAEERLPAGVAAIDSCPRAVSGDLAPSIVRVNVRGEDLGALIDPTLLQGSTRVLHEDYPSTREYMALFLATLKRLNLTDVAHLVTGLPVTQALNPMARRSLESRLVGTHELGPGHKVVVKEVTVLPQPIGAWLALAQDKGVAPQGRVLVFDAGHYSVDWVVLDQGQLMHQSSSSAHQAGSRLLEIAAEGILHDHGVRVSPSRIEQAVRGGMKQMSVGDVIVDLHAQLATAAKKITPGVIGRVREGLRNDLDSISHVVLAGGATPAYLGELRLAFPRARFHDMNQGVLANARGFWLWALAQRDQRARRGAQA